MRGEQRGGVERVEERLRVGRAPPVAGLEGLEGAGAALRLGAVAQPAPRPDDLGLVAAGDQVRGLDLVRLGHEPSVLAAAARPPAPIIRAAGASRRRPPRSRPFRPCQSGRPERRACRARQASPASDGRRSCRRPRSPPAPAPTSPATTRAPRPRCRDGTTLRTSTGPGSIGTASASASPVSSIERCRHSAWITSDNALGSTALVATGWRASSNARGGQRTVSRNSPDRTSLPSPELQGLGPGSPRRRNQICGGSRVGHALDARRPEHLRQPTRMIRLVVSDQNSGQ